MMVETARLRLRPHGPGDIEARARLLLEAGTMRHIGGEIADAAAAREESWARILRYRGHWALFGWGLFAIEDKATGRFLGECGFASFERGLGADFDAAPEGAWLLGEAAAGRGYATEAVRAAIGWLEGACGRQRLVCVIAPENHASIRVAEKLGFARYAERHYRDAPRLLFARLP